MAERVKLPAFSAETFPMIMTDDLKRILADALQLGERTQSYDASTPLLGAILDGGGEPPRRAGGALR